MDLKETYLNIKNAIDDDPIVNIPHCEKLKAFSLRSEKQQGYSLLPLSFNIVLEVPSNVIRQEKEISNPNW